MPRPQDITGLRFTRLMVLNRESNRKRHIIWRCRCDCGEIRFVDQFNLQSGNTKSCGCFKKAGLRKIHGDARRKQKTRLFVIWIGMLQRCNNPKRRDFPHYGGRGITVCQEWSDYEPFRNWALGNGYMPNLSLDRRDNNEGYSPRNCRWATMKEQSNNRRQAGRMEQGLSPDTIAENPE